MWIFNRAHQEKKQVLEHQLVTSVASVYVSGMKLERAMQELEAAIHGAKERANERE
jgi:hypothetical protein